MRNSYYIVLLQNTLAIQGNLLTKGGATRGRHTSIAYAMLERTVTEGVVSSSCSGQTSDAQEVPEAICPITPQGVSIRNGGPRLNAQHRCTVRPR